jgi:hypothetical protein
MLATLPVQPIILPFTNLTPGNAYRTVHIYVISMLSVRPVHRNLPHLTILTLGELSKRLASCYVISMLATYPAHHNLLHLSILTLGELSKSC